MFDTNQKTPDMWTYDAKTNLWSEIIQPIGSPVPQARLGHCMVLWKNKILLFGGFAGATGSNFLQDFWVYDIKLNSWQKLNTINTPTSRQRHSCAVYRNQMYIMFGIANAADLQSRVLKDIKFAELSGLLTGDTSIAFTDFSTGSDLESRFSSRAIVYENFLIWIGGQSETNVLNDFWRIDLSAPRATALSQVHTNLNPPRPRALHEAATIGNKMLVFGGTISNNEITNELLMYDIDKQTWLVPDIKSEKPLPRTGHQVAAFGDSLFVFGGQYEANTYLNDLWQYSILQNTWVKIEPSKVSDIPSPRAYHSMGTNGTHLFVFGGKYVNVLDEFFMFDISKYHVLNVPSNVAYMIVYFCN